MESCGPKEKIEVSAAQAACAHCVSPRWLDQQTVDSLNMMDQGDSHRDCVSPSRLRSRAETLSYFLAFMRLRETPALCLSADPEAGQFLARLYFSCLALQSYQKLTVTKNG